MVKANLEAMQKKAYDAFKAMKKDKRKNVDQEEDKASDEKQPDDTISELEEASQVYAVSQINPNQMV